MMNKHYTASRIRYMAIVKILGHSNFEYDYITGENDSGLSEATIDASVDKVVAEIEANGDTHDVQYMLSLACKK